MSIKQAIEALESCDPGDYSTGHVIHPSYDEEKVSAALAALRSMPAEHDREAFYEGYEAAQADAKVCELPPLGWICTRTRGHAGPCAAVESPDDAKLVADGMKRLKGESDPLEKLTRENERLGLYDDMGAPTEVEPTAEKASVVEPEERAEFEAWLVDNRFDASIVDGQYTAIFTRNAWLAWQARASKGTK